MVTYIYGQDRMVADFVAGSKRASGFHDAGFSDKKLRAIGIANENNELVAGLVYFNWQPQAGTIEMSVEARPKQRWLTRKTLAIMFQYPFLQCRCQLLMTKTAARSEHVLRMLASMNFSLIRVPRAGGRNEDAVLALLTVEDWMSGKFCKRFRHDLLDETTKHAA